MVEMDEDFKKALPEAPSGHHWWIGEGTREHGTADYGIMIATVQIELRRVDQVKRWFGRGYKDKVVTVYMERMDLGDFRDLPAFSQQDRLVSMANKIMRRKHLRDDYEDTRNTLFGEYR